MPIREFKTHIQNLQVVITTLMDKGVKLHEEVSPSVTDFEASRLAHHKRRYFITVELLKKNLADLKGLEPSQTLQLVNEVNLLSSSTLEQAREKIHKIAFLVAEVEPEENNELVSIPKKLPGEIKSELIADIQEIHTCFDSGAYRAVVILCGRLLETSLHWKYYNETGTDLLETSPGIGLGSIIAKLRDRKIEFDPGVTQQIHLINQVRVFSVHTKKQLFLPSEKQAKAIMLFTIDILEKLVK